MQHQKENINDKWHVGKEIPIAMIFGMLLQTFGVIWWAATLSGKIDSLAEQVTELKSDKRLQETAFKDIAVMDQRLNSNERRILFLEAAGARR